MNKLERLKTVLRPACGGIYTVSTGTAEQLRLQRRIYQAQSDEEVIAKWHESLDRLAEASVVMLGVPADIGAGFARGTSFGPQSIRRELLRKDSWLYSDERVIDAGDVFVVPQLLHDDMLSNEQIEISRKAIYKDKAGLRKWPVSPLSITEYAVGLIRQLAPKAMPLVMGGDHSVGWPVLAAVAKGREKKVGILHFDAHTDLLEERLGVKYCFATWAYHANELIGRGQRLQQVGLRISGRDRAYWEERYDLRQYWMQEIRSRPLDEIIEEIVASLRRAKVKGVYVSNDIDGTDPLFAQATGTPEPGGLEPFEVRRLIQGVCQHFEVWGADLVEVSPVLAGHSPLEPARTLATAAFYMEVQAELGIR